MEDDDDDYKQYDIRDGIIFLIELNDYIFKPLPQLDGKSQLLEILSSIDDLLQELIILLPNTGMGIYLYNCKNSNQSYELTKLSGLHDLSSTKMKYVHDLVTDDVQGRNKLQDQFLVGSNNENNLPKTLNKLINQFDKSNYKTKKLLWFTSNDKPFTSTNIRDSLYRIIEDAEDRRILINPIFLDNGTQKFDLKAFKDIFTSTGKLNNYKVDTTVLSQKIRQSIIRLKEIKRIQFTCNLILGDGKLSGNFGCSVRGYTLYNHEKLTKTRNLYYHNNQLKLVETESSLKNESGNTLQLGNDANKSIVELKNDIGIKSGIELNDGDEKTILHLGPQQWEFLKNYAFDNNPHDEPLFEDIKSEDTGDIDEEGDEDDEVPNTDIARPAYLKLLGFRGLHHFKPYYNLSSPSFVTGDYTNGTNNSVGYEDSLKTMSRLYKSCIKLQKYAIVFGCTKRNSLPALYALYPTNVSRSTKSDKVDFPHGFLLIKMPWLEDIRSLPESAINNELHKYPINTKNSLANPVEIVDIYKKIIDLHMLDHYNPGDFPNPTINYYYKILKHNLLQIPFDDKDKLLQFNDATYSIIEKNFNEFKSNDELAKLPQFLHQYLDKFNIENQTSPPLKKQKVDKPDDTLSLEQVVTAWKTNSLHVFTVSQLKSFARSQKITMGAKKDVLINNIVEFINARQKKVTG